MTWLKERYFFFAAPSIGAGWTVTLNNWFVSHDPILKGVLLIVTIIATVITILVGLKKLFWSR